MFNDRGLVEKLFKKLNGTYYKSTRLSNGQSVVMFFSRREDEGKDVFDIGLVVGKNRKQCMSWFFGETTFLDGRVTGKQTNPKEIYNFAIDSLVRFQEYIVGIKGSAILVVGASDGRRFKIYKKILTKELFGFKEHHQTYTLIKKL